MDPISGLVWVSNGWVMWILLSITFVILYLSLRFFVWKDHVPEERVIFKRFLIVFLLSIFITSLTIYGMKITLQVPRPCVPCTDSVSDCNPYCPADFSFPSGHSGTIFALFVSFFLIYRRNRSLPLFIFPVIVAYSRIFLGVHTYVDVIAGSILGIVIPVIVWKIERFFRVLKA